MTKDLNSFLESQGYTSGLTFNPITMDIKIKLSTLWIVIMLNLIFADILSIMIELVNKNTLDIVGGEVTTAMAIAAIVTNIPILMVYLSRALPFKINRISNILAAFITIFYVIGGGSLTPHYVIIASIEVSLLLIIVWNAWKWNNQIIVRKKLKRSNMSLAKGGLTCFIGTFEQGSAFYASNEL